jgi:hypothetical protein
MHGFEPFVVNSTPFCIAYFGSKLFGAPEDWFSNLEERDDPALLSFDSFIRVLLLLLVILVELKRLI